MKLEELSHTIAQGADEAVILATAVAQRLAGIPQGWDWETEAAVCRTCGMLLVKLPTTVATTRTVVVFGKPMQVRHVLTHAHAARLHDGLPACTECVDRKQPCLDHEAEMCELPEPRPCQLCGDDPALPESRTNPFPEEGRCRTCSRIEPEWDKDVYLGL